MNEIIKARINCSVNLKKADDLNMSSCNPIKKDKIDPIKIRFIWFINLKSIYSWWNEIFAKTIKKIKVRQIDNPPILINGLVCIFLELGISNILNL